MKNLNLILILLIVTPLVSAGLSFAQTTNIQAPSPDSVIAPAPTTVKPLPADTGATVAPTPAPTPIPSTNTTAVRKCGVNTFAVNNECGFGAFKNAYIQCYDGYEEKLGGENSCKSSEIWQKYAAEVCANRCGAVEEPQPMPMPEPKLLPTPKSAPMPVEVKPVEVKPIAICSIPDKLTKDYNRLILDLRKAEEAGDKEAAEAIIKKITALKLEIERARKECLANTSQPTVIQAPTTAARPAAPMSINRCAEVAQWENKIVYYQKLAALSDQELKEQTGFSREEVERILADLPPGLVKVKAQCEEQKTAGASPSEAVKQIIAEPVKPVAVESGQEIDAYYKAKIEKITVSENTEEQIVKLKTLRSEIDELVTNLIKGRKEIEASEFQNLVEETKISKGEIKADNVSVEATGKKILIEVGNKPVSIEPTATQVLIKDKNLEITAAEVSIKGEVLKVGNAEVKLAASAVAEKLNIAPKTVELKEQNSKAVYEMKVPERRRLFGFIPLTLSKTITADAENGNVVKESRPWYSFLTTK